MTLVHALEGSRDTSPDPDADTGEARAAAARARAAGALDSWRDVEATPKDTFIVAGVGTKFVGGPKESINGSWVDGNSTCDDEMWGNWYIHMADAGEPVVYVSIYATRKNRAAITWSDA